METLQIEETKQREMNVWEVMTIKTQPHRFHVNTGLKFDVCYQHKSYQIEDAIKQLYNRFPHFLMYLHSRNLLLTPHSKFNLMLPEEIPILFAYFHLSNIVRYDPITLKRLFDSSAIGVLEALARHAKFKYLLLFGHK